MSLDLLPGIKSKEIRRLEKIKQACPVCSGSGFVMKHVNDRTELDDCKCVKRIKEEYSLLRFNIPPKYRRWNMDKLNEDFVRKNKRGINIIKKYVQTLDDQIQKGSGLWLSSPPGLGKSSMICYILKQALKKGYVPYFGRATHFVDIKFKALGRTQDAEEARNILKFISTEVDILAIEEIDKVYLPGNESMPNRFLYEFLSEIYDSNVALLVSSNKDREEFESSFPWFIQDRLTNLQTVLLSWGALSGRKHA